MILTTTTAAAITTTKTNNNTNSSNKKIDNRPPDADRFSKSLPVISFGGVNLFSCQRNEKFEKIKNEDTVGNCD